MNKLKRTILKTILLFAIATILVPVFFMILLSFSKNYQWSDLFPTNFGFRGWSYLASNSSRMFSSLKNSVIISLATTLVTILISIPCAKSLAFDSFKFKKFVEMLVFAPVVIPMVSVGMGLNVMFLRMGLARTYHGIILVSIVPCIPYAVSMIKEVYLIIGDGLNEQARMLGGSGFYIFRKITIPTLLPGVLSAGMMSYIIAFSQYFLVQLIGGGKIITFTMEMLPFIQSGDRMMGSVYGLVFIFSTLFFLILMDHIIKRVYRNELEGYVYV